MPTKDLAHFSYISPQKTLFSTIKYKLTIEFLSTKGKNSEKRKKDPSTNPATVPLQKFLLLLQYKLFIGVDEMRVKNITITVSIRVSAMVRVSLVLLFALLCRFTRLALVLRLGSV